MASPTETRTACLLVADDLDRKLALAVGALEAVDWLLRDLPRLPDRSTHVDRRRHRRRR